MPETKPKHKHRAVFEAAQRRRMKTWRATVGGLCAGCGNEYRADPGRQVDLISSIDGRSWGWYHYRCACKKLDIRYRANGVTPV